MSSDSIIVAEYEVPKELTSWERQRWAAQKLKEYGKRKYGNIFSFKNTSSDSKMTGYTLVIQGSGITITLTTIEPRKDSSKLLISQTTESDEEAEIMDKIECKEYTGSPIFKKDLKYSPFANLQLKK